MRLFGHSGENVETIALDGHFADLISQSTEFLIERVPHRAFIPSDGFDIDQPTRKRNDVHAGENTAIGCGATGVPARRTHSACIYDSFRKLALSQPPVFRHATATDNPSDSARGPHALDSRAYG